MLGGIIILTLDGPVQRMTGCRGTNSVSSSACYGPPIVERNTPLVGTLSKPADAPMARFN